MSRHATHRFYDPEGGRILLGGRDLSTYKPADISNVVSWVTQEPQLFPISGTLCFAVLSLSRFHLESDLLYLIDHPAANTR